jgi:hypothetical protein
MRTFEDTEAQPTDLFEAPPALVPRRVWVDPKAESHAIQEKDRQNAELKRRCSRPTVQITVAELIVQLQALPPGAKVWSDGCDCVGEACCAELDVNGDVLIARMDP